MKHSKIIFVLIPFVLLAVFTHAQAVGKSESAPGQVKKTTEPTPTAGTMEDVPPIKNVKPQTPPGKELKESAMMQKIEATASQRVKETTEAKEKMLEQKTFVQNLKTNTPPKLGALKVKELLLNTSTPSGQKNEIKKVKMIYATPSAQLSKRHGVQGVISSLSDDMIVLVHPIQQNKQTTIKVNPATVITGKDIASSGSATLVVGQRIAVVGEPSSDYLLAKRIHIIPGKAIGLVGKNPLASPSAVVKITPTFTPSPTATSSSE